MFIILGILSALTVLIVMWRVNLKLFLGYPAIMDVLVTLALLWALSGTLGGMAAGVIGGLFFSLAITLLRKYHGYSKLGWDTWHPALVYMPPDVMFGKPPFPKLPVWLVVLIVACVLTLMMGG